MKGPCGYIAATLSIALGLVLTGCGSGSSSSKPVLTTPTVVITPGSASITTAQALTVAVSVSGGGASLPTGTVTLSSGTYSSGATVLSGGSASVKVPGGSLPAGNLTLTARYTPDASSSGTYSGASGTAPLTVTTAASYVLTIKSVAPSSGISMTVSPSDNNGGGNGATTFTRTYNAGTPVAVSAPLSASGYSFVSWSGCTSNPVAGVCNITMNADATVTAAYNQAGITSITVTPATATIGIPQQFSASVKGNGSFSKSVTWSLSCPSCGNIGAGTLSGAGFYITPYPAPPSVVITATSTQTPSISGSAIVSLDSPPAGAGPALWVDAGKSTHPISPFIYGMNGYTLTSSAAKAVNLPVDRWGGDATSRYNYQLNVTNSAGDWFFENNSPAPSFDAQVTQDASVGAATMGTVPVLGWVAKDSTSCSFAKSTYPNQVAFDSWKPTCGDGIYPEGVNGCTDSHGCAFPGNDPTLTDQPAGPAWAGNWVAYLVHKFGKAADGGVAIYDLDNEPAWWDAVHRDVHPLPSTYDEVTNNGIATAKAIKAADPTAAVSGPVVDYWWNYFYSKKDVENGWRAGGPCWQPWSNPVDRQAHGGIPFIEYYLQQFKAAETGNGARLLDYLDLHTYFAGQYNGASVGFAPAGDTEQQKVRLDSTRVFWDPNYTDPNFSQPNYPTDPNYTDSCTTPLQSPQLIPMAQQWVARDYPGTKVAFTEYNWGGQESMNGAVAQADILGIFGKFGLDLGTLWGPPDPVTQVPGLMAFAIYRNYDGKNAMFGDLALDSSTADQEKLSVYGATRASDGALTIMVLNKTYGSLTSSLTLQNFLSSRETAQVYQYSNANLAGILAQPAIPITLLPGASGASILNATYPAQSITLLIVPQ